jgi:pyridoxamine 5'-phosphate oxidase
VNKSEIIAAINANPVCYMATVEGSQPRVRGMGMYKADERGLIFQTWTKKDLHGQLLKNPQVELCYAVKDGGQIRISGKLELVDDLALKKEIEAKRTFMTAVIKQFGGYDVVAIWVLKKGRAQIWTMKDNFAPKAYVEI